MIRTTDYGLRNRNRSAGLDERVVAAAVGLGARPARAFNAGNDSPFHTPTGKIELFSQELADAGFDPIPVFETTEEPPDGYYRLLNGQVPVHTFAKTQDTPSVERRLSGERTLYQ